MKKEQGLFTKETLEEHRGEQCFVNSRSSGD